MQGHLQQFGNVLIKHQHNRHADNKGEHATGHRPAEFLQVIEKGHVRGCLWSARPHRMLRAIRASHRSVRPGHSRILPTDTRLLIESLITHWL